MKETLYDMIGSYQGGFNKDGFDFHGFDKYGFIMRGFNRNKQLVDNEEKVKQAIKINPWNVLYAKDKNSDSDELKKEFVI